MKSEMALCSSEQTETCSTRIAVVGPVLPYRGGIAQHTTMLHRALSKKSECLTLSFSRQYPAWLFPGKSDIDDSFYGHKEPGVEYDIDSVNPVSWFRAVQRILDFNPDLVLFPWWHVYWAPCFTWITRRLRKCGIQVVYFCHNAVEHESATWKRFISDIALSSADRFIVHTSKDKNNLLERFPNAHINVHPHPVYEQFPPSKHVLPRRAKVELLFFGFVRPYKGLEVLLSAMSLLKNEDVYLSVVGEIWDGEEEIINFIKKHEISNNVEINARYVSEAEAADYFSRCDIVVLPYYNATGSGVIPVAYHYKKPVIATRVGGLSEVVWDGQTGALVNSGSDEEIANVVRSVLARDIVFNKTAIEEIKKHLTWSGLADAVLGEL